MEINNGKRKEFTVIAVGEVKSDREVELQEENEALRELVEEAYNTGFDIGQIDPDTRGWEAIEEKLKEIGGE